jgi:hypothetical protein
MWRDPYLETCCRSALHRVASADSCGRPGGLADEPCLLRLARMGMVALQPEGRYMATALGMARYRSEILRLPAVAPPSA